MSRYSIRNFSKEPVPEELIRDVVRIAQKSPSVCNRQSWHVYVIKDPALKEKALALQNGNRGFGHTADFVAVITSDLQTFASAGGRNQCFIDGGLFAMSLMYALHSKGVGTCPLNWMVEPSQDRKLRAVVPIRPSENVIMMMVGGFLPERLIVPKSARISAENSMTLM
jgi:nitroreductase